MQFPTEIGLPKEQVETKKKQATEVALEERAEDKDLAGEIAEVQADRLKWPRRRCYGNWQSEGQTADLGRAWCTGWL